MSPLVSVAALLPLAAMLEPLELVSNKMTQTTALRAYTPQDANGGLQTATLAMGCVILASRGYDDRLAGSRCLACWLLRGERSRTN
eukprot:2706939-Pleurochrysis_carterae.AAC.1